MVREPEILPTNLGELTIEGPVDGLITIRWDNTDAILQHSASLTPDSWQNVPGSQTTREIVFSVSEVSENYFRLATP